MNIKELGNVTFKPNINNKITLESVMKTVDTASTKEATEIIVNILDITYASTNIEKVLFSAT